MLSDGALVGVAVVDVGAVVTVAAPLHRSRQVLTVELVHRLQTLLRGRM